MRPPRSSPRRYFETLRHLQPEQLRYQVRHRLDRLWPSSPAPRVPRHLELHSKWRPRVPRAYAPPDARVLDGQFRYWGVERRIDPQRPWRASELGRSWNFPVHYFDEMAALAATADAHTAARIRERIDDWIRVHPAGRGIAWDPYTTALRIVNWLDIVAHLQDAAEPAWCQRVLGSVYQQTRWLEQRFERHLLGTHLLKNLKAVAVATSVFADAAMRRARQSALRLLHRELEAQVAADGGHVEPSLMYHCMALADVLDLLNFAAALDDADRDQAREVAERMLRFTAAVATPTGSYPLHGDAWEGGEPGPADLLAYGQRLGLQTSQPSGGLTWLEDSALLVWRDAHHWLFADVGGVGPPHLPGHGHCDSLSFEWHLDSKPLVVDSGVFSYEPGALRQECRSTAAHNTLRVDGREQHEIWDAFRVARRSRVHASAAGAGAVEATLVPWFDGRVRVQRRFACRDGEIRIEDRVEGPGRRRVESRLHFDPDCRVRLESGERGGELHLEQDGVRARIQCRSTAALELLPAATSASRHARVAGELRPNAVARLVHEGALPFESRMILTAD